MNPKDLENKDIQMKTTPTEPVEGIQPLENPKDASAASEEQTTEAETPATVEDLQSQISNLESQLAEVTQERDNFAENNAALIELFEQNPDVPVFLKMLSEGMIAEIDFENMTFVPGNPEQFKKSVEGRKAAKQAFLQALEKSKEIVARHLESLPEEDRDDYSSRASEFINAIMSGQISEDLANVLYRGINHDRLSKKAVDDAVLEARNARIEDFKDKKSQKGDGLPALQSSTAVEEKPAKDMWDKMAERFGD